METALRLFRSECVCVRVWMSCVFVFMCEIFVVCTSPYLCDEKWKIHAASNFCFFEFHVIATRIGRIFNTYLTQEYGTGRKEC